MSQLTAHLTHRPPNPDFAQLASAERIVATQEALNANNFQTVVVDTAEAARHEVLSLLPEGAKVHMGSLQMSN